MFMQNISMGICKKPSLDEPEDLVGGNHGFYWLLDGATPPFGQDNHMRTLHYIYQLNASLSKCSLTAKSTKELLRCALDDAKNNLENFSSNHDYLPYSTAILVKLGFLSVEYSVLGDSSLGICINGQSTVITDNRLKKIAVSERSIVRQMRAEGINEKSPEYLEARRKLIMEEQRFQNIEHGYWVACLDPTAAEHAINGKIHMEQSDRAMIFATSDGLSRLVSHFSTYRNICDIGTAILEKGERTIFSELRFLESNIENFKKPISSQHDDSSYFLITNY